MPTREGIGAVEVSWHDGKRKNSWKLTMGNNRVMNEWT